MVLSTFFPGHENNQAITSHFRLLTLEREMR